MRQQFDDETGRFIRTYVGYKVAPAFAALFILLGALAFGLLFPLGVWLERTLYWFFNGGPK